MPEESSNTLVIPLEDAPANLDLSPWTGRRETVAGAAGEARIAQVSDLRRIRDDRLYANLTGTWEEFCEKHLGISRRSVDRNIRRLKEFGPAFFRVAEAVPISSHEYRMIREHICPEGVRIDGVLIPFGERNGRCLAAALTELLRRDGPKLGRTRAESFTRVAARLEAAAKALDRYDRTLDRLQKLELSALVGRMSRRALDFGVRLA
jgi:hypothetical protein